MTAPNESEYILGTGDVEIDRLGRQHGVWRSDAAHAWRRAGFRPGNTVLDVGCGPGFAPNRRGARATHVPWHGRVTTGSTVKAFRNMIVTVRDRVQGSIGAGRTADQVVAERPQRSSMGTGDTAV